MHFVLFTFFDAKLFVQTPTIVPSPLQVRFGPLTWVIGIRGGEGRGFARPEPVSSRLVMRQAHLVRDTVKSSTAQDIDTPRLDIGAGGRTRCDLQNLLDQGLGDGLVAISAHGMPRSDERVHGVAWRGSGQLWRLRPLWQLCRQGRFRLRIDQQKSPTLEFITTQGPQEPHCTPMRIISPNQTLRAWAAAPPRQVKKSQGTGIQRRGACQRCQAFKAWPKVLICSCTVCSKVGP